jgi:ABC-type Fe3+-hydroxamate transport system substrate-binding protein
VRQVPDVGPAIGVAIERVVTLRPDLVVLVAGSDNARTVSEFDRLGVRSVVFRMNRLEDLRSTITRLGAVLDRRERADSLWASIDGELADVRRRTASLGRPNVYYDIAYPPPFTIGRGSYLDSLIFIAGGRNAFHDVEAPSPTVSLEAIVDRDPDVIVFPVSREWTGAGSPVDRPLWSSLRAVRENRVREVDADLLHRLGPRIGTAVRALALVLHPELRPELAAPQP